ncbi:MAG: hypothetical protein J6X30_02500 [Clostridia bacterium]|nr:hypothetical protein [Clostridia bacterium]
MKNAKWIVLLSCLITVALLACCFIFPFSRTVEAGGTNLITVEFNDSFDRAVVENAMREAGATDVLVLKQVSRTGNTSFEEGTSAQIYFSVPDGTEAKEVYDKAEEILSQTFAFKYPGTLSTLSASLTKQSVISLWPVLIVLVVLLAYAALRFGIRTGVIAAALTLMTGIAVLGVTAIARIGLSHYTIAALLGTAALSELFVFLFAFTKRDFAKRTAGNVTEAAAKRVTVFAVLLSCMAIVGLVSVLILGNAALKGFALTALIGTVFSACAAVFTLPALASLLSKAN